MKVTGIILLAIGVIAFFVGVSMDTTIATGFGGQRVHNIGLMNDRQNAIIVAGVLAVIGAIFVGFSKKSQPASENATDNSSVRICPYCAETVKAAATICRFCQKELPPSAIASVVSEIHGELSRPPGMPIGVWRENVMAANGIKTEGDWYVWNGSRYASFDMVVAAMKQQPA